jgi:cytoskeletal protein CcmA (bactofilin family)
MTELLASIILFGMAIVWFSLPLVPTILEVRKRGAARPLSIDRANEGEIRHFAHTFKTFLESNFRGPSLRECIDQGMDLQGKLDDGTRYRVVPSSGERFAAATAETRSVPELIIFSAPTVLPAGLEFVHGVYAAEDIDCGSETLTRALYGARNVRLGEGAVVLRWIHVDKELVAGAGCALYGRASAEQAMRIGPGAEFERLYAPRIVFENGEIAAPANGSADTRLQLVKLQATRMAEHCYAIDSDLDLPPDSLIRGDFVVRGAVRIGRNSRVEGSIKSQKGMSIQRGSTIQGSVIGGELEIESDCRIRGPVAASGEIIIHTGCRLGEQMHPTSVTAPYILVDPGVLAFGTVWARERGIVAGRIAS